MFTLPLILIVTGVSITTLLVVPRPYGTRAVVTVVCVAVSAMLLGFTR